MDRPAGPQLLQALIDGLRAQGQMGVPNGQAERLARYPIKGTIDLMALADAIENALGGSDAADDGKEPAELNAANDG